MNPTLYVRSAKALAAAAALSFLLAAGPGSGGPGGNGPGPRPQNSQSGGQPNQQCPPGQSQGQESQGQPGAPSQIQGNGGGQTSLMDPGGGPGSGGQGAQGGQGMGTQGPAEQGQQGGQAPGGQGQNQGPPSRQRPQGQTLSGTVSGYNLNPSGMPESMMLNTGGSAVQLNFPPEMAVAVQRAAAVGNQVSVVAGTGGPGMPNDAPDREHQPYADHVVMNLESVKSAAGQTITVGGPGGGKNGRVEGTVKQLNYDRRGMVDGVQLDTGIFVHLRPNNSAPEMSVGEKLTVQGRQHTTTSGLKIIEAESINGTSITGDELGGGGGPGQ